MNSTSLNMPPKRKKSSDVSSTAKVVKRSKRDLKKYVASAGCLNNMVSTSHILRNRALSGKASTNMDEGVHPAHL